MNLETDVLVPPTIQTAYDISNQDSITRLSGGHVNDTLLVDQGEHKFILRRLAPVLGASTVRNACVITDHLRAGGWEAPTIGRTVTGKLHTTDETGRLWHSMAHIPSDTISTLQHDATLALQAGQVLGSWHLSVKSLDFSPESLPHFHDTAYIAKKLDAEVPLLEDKKAQNLARLLLDNYRQQRYTLPEELQVIHGDPKLDNMLYRDNEPFTLIDLDCAMRESVWTDVGDFLRSLSGKLVGTGQEIAEVVTGFTKGYLAGNESNLSTDEAIYYALQATQRIAGELGMRYLSDTVDGQEYFSSWDQTVYESREEALYDRALLQYKVTQIVKETLNEG
jgi:Ser/Thr protein kinase RdoA (MazF antagonist)